MRFTLDSNILVRAAVSPQGPALRLSNIILRSHTLVLSHFILSEVERVLLYPRIQARYQITASEAAQFAASLAYASHLVEPAIPKPLVLSDPADDAVLYTAVDGNADVLCTCNVRHFGTAEVLDFCASRGIRIHTDLEILRYLREPESGEDLRGIATFRLASVQFERFNAKSIATQIPCPSPGSAGCFRQAARGAVTQRMYALVQTAR